MTRRAVAAAVLATLVLSTIPTLPSPACAQQDLWETSYEAWDRGDYVKALRGFDQILQGPQAATFLERIALLTGELYVTTELTPDGASPAISPDGGWATYLSGSGGTAVTALVPLGGQGEMRMLDGSAAMFSSDGRRLLLQRVEVTPDLEAARAALAQSDRSDRTAYSERLQAVRSLEARNTRLVVVPLEGGREQTLRLEGMRIQQAVFGAGSRDLFVLASPLEDPGTPAILRIPGDGRGAFRAPVTIVPDASGVRGLEAAAGGRYLVSWSGGGFSRGGRAPGTISVYDLDGGAPRAWAGDAPALSADGRTIAWSESADGTTRILVAPVAGGDPRTVVASETARVNSFILSPSGARLAYMGMPYYDWEIYVVGTAAEEDPLRVTREIQHDLNPMFLDENTLFAVIGEGRHRRSYTYDLTSMERTRLFHNNTVRTIAPEYEWHASADGTRIIILSERDGDTVSPERGVYVVDRTKKVSRDGLLERIRADLASEQDLRVRGEQMFARISQQVQRVTEQVSITHLYDHEKALYDFDSKNITRPGNAKAAKYIYDAFASYGYEPEYQWFEARGGRGSSEPIRTANVLATLKGTESPEIVYVLSSHFDSNARGPGADDNTTGAVVVLEAARVLAKNPLPATIIFAAFTGEESGLLGSREFVRQAVEHDVHIAGALNNDMFGWSGDHRLDNTIRYSNAGIRDVQHAAAFLFSDLITYDALYYKSTDAAAYYEAYGDIVGGIGSYPVLGNPHYHQYDDVLETINHELVRETCKTTVASLMLLASSPSRLTGMNVASRQGRNARVTWDPAPETGKVTYLVIWGVPGRAADRRTVEGTSIDLQGVPDGTVVSVKAVNAHGLEGWDWARVVIGER